MADVVVAVVGVGLVVGVDVVVGAPVVGVDPAVVVVEPAVVVVVDDGGRGAREVVVQVEQADRSVHAAAESFQALRQPNLGLLLTDQEQERKRACDRLVRHPHQAAGVRINDREPAAAQSVADQVVG